MSAHVWNFTSLWTAVNWSFQNITTVYLTSSWTISRLISPVWEAEHRHGTLWDHGSSLWQSCWVSQVEAGLVWPSTLTTFHHSKYVSAKTGVPIWRNLGAKDYATKRETNWVTLFFTLTTFLWGHKEIATPESFQFYTWAKELDIFLVEDSMVKLCILLLSNYDLVDHCYSIIKILCKQIKTTRLTITQI